MIYVGLASACPNKFHFLNHCLNSVLPKQSLRCDVSIVVEPVAMAISVVHNALSIPTSRESLDWRLIGTAYLRRTWVKSGMGHLVLHTSYLPWRPLPILDNGRRIRCPPRHKRNNRYVDAYFQVVGVSGRADTWHLCLVCRRISIYIHP